MAPDVAEAGRPQERVDDGVAKSVAVGVTHNFLVGRQSHPTEDDAVAAREPVYVESDADPQSSALTFLFAFS
jgi:hypothetical protein